MWTWSFWRDALERAVRAAAVAALGAVGTDGLGLLRIGWLPALTTAGLAGLGSLLLSIVGSGVGATGTPSLLPARPPVFTPLPAPPGGRHARD